MRDFSISKIVHLSSIKLYNVLSNVDNYQNIWIYIRESKVINNKDSTVLAYFRVGTGLNIALLDKLISNTFSFRCTVELKENLIVIKSIDGQFKYLKMEWKLKESNTENTNITLNMEYKFKSMILQKISTYYIDRFLNYTINALHNYLIR